MNTALLLPPPVATHGSTSMGPTSTGPTSMGPTSMGPTSMGPTGSMTVLVGEPTTPSVVRAVPATAELRQIGRYPVMGMLGEGGMGSVYAAYDEQLDRRIAIKLLLPRGGARDQRAQARIRREAQAMARLAHPSIAHVYEVGQWQGRTYISMEYVRGSTLKEWAKQPRTVEERVDVLLQAGRGLVAAHRAGVVHRDFKPDNVMIDRHGRVRVLDFGLAKASDDSVDRTQQTIPPPMGRGGACVDLTCAGTVMGTPAYMSPEQHMGAETTAAADQYGFCAVAYELLYGVRPFTGPNRLAIFHAIHLGALNPIPADHGVPAAVQHVLRRGLAREHQARWPSMEALVDALEAAVGARRRRWLWPAMAGALLLIGALVSLLLVQSTAIASPVPSRVESVAQAAIAAGAQARWVYPLAEQPLDTALVYLFELDAIAADEDEPDAVVEAAQARAAELRRDFGQALRRLGDTYWDRPEGRVFARDFYLQSVLFDGSPGPARERCGFTNGELADLRARAVAGELSQAEIDAGEQLIELASVVIEAEEPGQVELGEVLERARRRRVASLRRRFGGTSRAESKPSAPVEPEAELVVEDDDELVIEDEVSPEQDDEEARAAALRESKALAAAGDKLRKAGRVRAAEAKYFAALRHYARNARAHDGLRRLKFDAGRYAEAVPHAEKAVRYASGHARYRRSLGDTYYKVGRLADAERAYTKAVAMGDAKAEQRLSMIRDKGGGR